MFVESAGAHDRIGLKSSVALDIDVEISLACQVQGQREKWHKEAK